MQATMQMMRGYLVRPLDSRTTLLVLAILALNLVDGFATLRHLSYGAEELNPFMEALLRQGASRFLVIKHLLASLGVLGIAIHDRVRAARVALWILFPLYAVIVAYQAALFCVIR
jgi:hypothetical protein